jgi:pimeloyl-ACP methyl ester carboxylesterase
VADWGGILGLLLPLLFPDLIGYLVVMNTALGLGVPPTAAWLAFRDYMQRTPNCNIGALLKRGTPLSAHEQAMYDAPFAAGEVSKAGVRRFPVSRVAQNPE